MPSVALDEAIGAKLNLAALIHAEIQLDQVVLLTRTSFLVVNRSSG